MSMSSSDCMRSISTTGTVAAPVTANRSERQVVVAALGVVEQRLVDRRRPGQHGDAVVLRPRACACSGSNVSCGISVAPVCRQARMPAL